MVPIVHNTSFLIISNFFYTILYLYPAFAPESLSTSRGPALEP